MVAGVNAFDSLRHGWQCSGIIMRAAVSYIENHSAKINTNTNAVWCQTGPGRYFPSFEFASVGCRLLSRLALGNHFDDAVRSYRTEINNRYVVVVTYCAGCEHPNE